MCARARSDMGVKWAVLRACSSTRGPREFGEHCHRSLEESLSGLTRFAGSVVTVACCETRKRVRA